MEQELKPEKTRETMLREAAALRELLYKNVPDFHERLIAHLQTLQKRHPDYDDYQMYHLVIGSSEEREKVDFPGEDSLLSWLHHESASTNNE